MDIDLSLKLFLVIQVILKSAVQPDHTTVVALFAFLQDLDLDMVLLKKSGHSWMPNASSQHFQEALSQIQQR